MENTLFIPMAVEALCVTTHMNVPLQSKWEMQYKQLEQYETPEPSGCHVNDGDKGRAPGVYLNWTLPLALRTAGAPRDADGNANGPVAFPKIPNRYLVVRRFTDESGVAHAMAWLILADGQSIDNDDPPAMTPFLDPSTSGEQPRPLWIGIKVAAHKFNPEVHQSAFEDGYALDAGGCGNPAFAVFAPQNCNVLSFYDPVADMHVPDLVEAPTQHCIQRAKLHYTVLGWYDRAELSPLAGLSGDGLSKELTRKGWQLDQALPCAPNLVVGASVDGVDWDRDGSPANHGPEQGQIKLAFAPSLMEGLDTLMAYHLGKDKELEGLYESDDTAGFAALFHQQTALAPQAVSRERHAHAFAVTNGSRRYSLSASEHSASTEALPEIGEVQQQALEELRTHADRLTAQSNAFEQLCCKRQDIDWHLANISSGMYPIAGADGVWEYVGKELGEQRNKLVEQLQQHAQELELTAKTLAQKEQAFSQQLDKKLELRISAAGRNYHAQDPLLVIASARGSLSHRDDDTLLLGRDGIAVTLFAPTQTEPAWAWAGAAPWAALADTAPVAALRHILAEFAEARPHGDSLAGAACRAWVQPWTPLFLEWEITYADAPLYARDNCGNWRFTGRDYVLDPQGDAPHDLHTVELAHRTVLTPAIREAMRAELRRVLQDHQLTDNDIDERLAALDNWDFLSQRLNGLFDCMRGRDARAHYVPNQDGRFTPSDYMGAPVQPMVNVSDIDALLFHSSSFRHISGGQFRIKRLQLVDRFGQVAPVAGSWGQAGDYALDNKNCFVAPAMSAPQDLITKDAKHFSPSIQIPPRLLQPARLEFHLRSVGQSLDGLAGWWIWNRYNRALMVHSAQGKWLGMLHGIADGHAVFESAPGVPSLEELAGAGAQLSQELLAPLRAITAAIDGAARLDALGQLLDEAGWRIDPADEHGSWLSVLTGRPLAVVGASIRLTLEQQALSDPSFIHAFQDQGPATDITKLKDRLTRLALPNPLEQPLPLVIGDAHDPEEGLVGLWLADDFEVMRSPYASAHGPHPSGITFLDADHPLHASFADKEALHVTLLMDPFAKVYACCGLLPDQALSLPPQSFDDALRAMVPAFPMGPLLVEYEARADHATPGAYVEPRALLHTPIPPHEYGEWQWVDGSGEIFNLRHPGQEAHLDGRALHVRDGRMVLNPHHDEKNFSVK